MRKYNAFSISPYIGMGFSLFAVTFSLLPIIRLFLFMLSAAGIIITRQNKRILRGFTLLPAAMLVYGFALLFIYFAQANINLLLLLTAAKLIVYAVTALIVCLYA